MSLGCIIENISDDTPDELYDESSINLTIDNTGMSVLQMIILKKSSQTIQKLNFSYSFGSKEFVGFLDSDVPEKLTGTDYFEHKISAKGIVQ